MAAIDDLINKIADADLRARIAAEISKMQKGKKFGLVFENHLPECTPLYDVAVTVGKTVALKNSSLNDSYKVLSVEDGVACCLKQDTSAPVNLAVDDLVVLATFGESIYPYLDPIDSICNAPDSNLWHTLIEADNYHALQLLDYLYHGKVDCIYIDPPYNTGAKDWKYNNNYVDASDAYRHSKWLSFMQKRLALAKKLLSSQGCIFISIDDGEACHLKLLCDEIFGSYSFVAQIPWRKRTAKSDVPFGISQDFESVLCYANKDFKAAIKGKERKYYETPDFPDKPWRFHDLTTQRTIEERPNSNFTIINPKDGKKFPVNPLRCWAVTKDTFEQYYKENRIIFPGDYAFLKISKPVLRYWKENDIEKAGTDFGLVAASTYLPLEIVGMTQDGTKQTTAIFNDKRFNFPKPIGLVKHLINIATAKNPHALIVDFFAGSGTTLHAVNLLNAEDGGQRRCIMVTNNEVSVDEAKSLAQKGYRPGDAEWEALGVARYVTWPRTVCSIKGCDVNGNPLKGNYLGSDKPMADGFAANCAFFKLGFLDKTAVSLGRQFKELLPLLWLKSGAVGPCPKLASDEIPAMLALPQNKFAVLVDENYFVDFKERLEDHPEINYVYIVTNYEEGYRAKINELGVEHAFQLYRDYLDNFSIKYRRS